MSSATATSTKEAVQQLFNQFSNGCDSINCKCKWCKSCPNFPFKFNCPNEIASKVLEILKTSSFAEIVCPNLKTESPEKVVDIKTAIRSSDKQQIQNAFKRLFTEVDYFPYLFASKSQPIRKGNYQFESSDFKSFLAYLSHNIEMIDSFRNDYYSLVEKIIADDSKTYTRIRSIVLAFCFDNFLLFHTENQISQKFFLMIYNLSDEEVTVLIDMFSSVPPILLNSLMVCQTIITVLSHESFSSNKYYDFIKYACKMVRHLHYASLCSEAQLPYHAFFNDPLSKFFIKRQEIADFTPYLGALSLSLKARCMYREIMDKQRMTTHLDFEVSRQNIVEESIDFLTRVKPSHLTRKLSVFFTGEAGVDAGGLSREFFYLLVNAVFSPDYGMFRIINQNTYWFVHSDFSEPMKFNVLGTVVALAIANSVILPIRFPIALYKKLLGMKMTLEDLNQIEPDIVKGIKEMRQMVQEGKDVKELYLTFEATVTMFGDPIVVEFFKGGSEKDVTNENLEEYIQMSIDFYMNKHIANEFSAFQRGFKKLESLHILDYVLPDELDILVSGLPTRDWNIFKKGVKYENGYSQNSEPVIWFWRIFDEMSEEDKAALMQFITGTDRTPVATAKPNFLVIRRTPDVDALPEAHTCLNMLMLPHYPSEKVMKDKIIFAIKNSEGFNLL